MKVYSLLIGIALLSLAACKQAVAPASSAASTASTPAATAAVATVNGTQISRDMFEFYAKAASGKSSSELTPEQREQVLDALVRGEVVAQQAEKDGLAKDPDVQAMLSMARLEILQRAVQQRYLKGKAPTDAELHAEYDAQLAQMPKTEYHARHILVSSKEKADEITAQLRKGANFAQLASKESIDSTKAQGGDLGWFAPNSMVKPFSDALLTLKKGQITPAPVQTQFGWHIIKLEDTRAVKPPAFESTKQQLEQFVMAKKFKAYTDELLKAAKIDKKL